MAARGAGAAGGPTSSIPIVFVGVSDPVGLGYVASFAHPGGNVTGFTFWEPSMGGKWFEALKEIAPRLMRVAIMMNPETTTGQGAAILKAFQSAAPNVILSRGSQWIRPLLQQTQTIPIVFMNVIDPVGSGYVASLARPGGNVTSFTQFDYRISGKWLELLMEVAPSIAQVAVIRDPRTAYGIGQLAVIQALALTGLELFPVNAVSAAEIERAIAAFARSPNGGLIVTSGGTGFHRDVIMSLAARHRLPAIYPFRYYSVDGGLLSYGPNTIEPTRRAATYVDRILRGEKPADLPVQAPTSMSW
jgi:ABC-type uncharacterized transport system substrate-binding protein